MAVSRARIECRSLDVLAAVDDAGAAHDRWLATLDERHPFLGRGAPADEVTQELVAGITAHDAIAAYFKGLGIPHFGIRSLTHEKARRLREGFDAILTYPTDSQVGQVIWALRRLRDDGLVTHDRELRYWQVSPDGDRALEKVQR